MIITEYKYIFKKLLLKNADHEHINQVSISLKSEGLYLKKYPQRQINTFLTVSQKLNVITWDFYKDGVLQHTDILYSGYSVNTTSFTKCDIDWKHLHLHTVRLNWVRRVWPAAHVELTDSQQSVSSQCKNRGGGRTYWHIQIQSEVVELEGISWWSFSLMVLRIKGTKVSYLLNVKLLEASLWFVIFGYNI